jgi:hypothetical protein
MEFIDVWKRMSEVEIMVSLDEVESRGEYWRHGLEWNKFSDNVKKLLSVCSEHKHIKMGYAVTVSIFNVLRLSEIIDYLLEHNMINDEVYIDFNSALSCSSHLDVTSLPENVRLAAITKIDRTMTKLNDLGIDNSLESVRNKLEEKYSINGAKLKIAAENFAKLDVIRNQKLESVAPELYDIYRNHGYDEMLSSFIPYELPR